MFEEITTSLENYLRSQVDKTHEFIVTVSDINDEFIQIYIRPYNVDGETLDYEIIGNTSYCLTRKSA